MNRKKVLVITAVAGSGGIVGILLLYMLLNGLLLTPSAELDKKIEQRRDELSRLRRENDKQKSYVSKLKSFAGRTFEVEPLKAKESSRAHLADLILRSGLSPDNTTLAPLGLMEKSGNTEVGWNLGTRGSLDSVVNLLYLLNAEPYLCRVENLVITPIRRSTEVDVKLAYKTLVVAQQKGEAFTSSQPTTNPDSIPNLQGPERARYNLIAARDLFRPYIQRPPAPPVVSTPAEAPPAGAPNLPGPMPGRFRVVGLPSYGNTPQQAEVCVTDAQSGQTRTYRLGEQVEGLSIVWVDYRPLPSPQNPEILSPSRVVLRDGQDYYTVELGDSLDRKLPLTEDRWPKQLPRPLAASQPASAPTTEPARELPVRAAEIP